MPRLLVLAAALLAGPPTGRSSSGRTATASRRRRSPPWTDPPKVLWKQPVGDAHSSPVVADGVVYAFYKPKGKDADALAAFDATTGEKMWEKSYDREKFSPPFGDGPRGTPTVDGGKVYTLGGTGVLACWDAKTGDVGLEGGHAQGVQGEEPVLRRLHVADGGRATRWSSMVGGKGAGRRRLRQGDRQGGLEGDRRPGQLRLPAAGCGENAARLPDRQPPAGRDSGERQGVVGGAVQGQAEREFDDPGEGRRPDRRQLGDPRQRSA